MWGCLFSRASEGRINSQVLWFPKRETAELSGLVFIASVAEHKDVIGIIYRNPDKFLAAFCRTLQYQ